MHKLKEIRQANHRTQEEVADFLQITRASYTNIENGKRDPDTKTLIAFADFFGVSMDEIFGKIPTTEKEPVSSLTGEECKILTEYRNLNTEGRKYIKNTLFMASQIYKNESAKKTSDMEKLE